jgi:hypothetical protein
VRWQLENAGGRPLALRLTVSLSGGLGEAAVDMVTVPPGSRRALYQTPTLAPAAYRLETLANASLHARAVATEAGREATLFEQSFPLALRAKNDLVWGPRFRYARYLCAWITPHDPRVAALVGAAAQIARTLPSASGRRGITLGHYGLLGRRPEEVDANVEQVARALFLAVKRHGLSFVSSAISFGEADVQRIRLPHESLEQHAANCVDGAVLYASLFENLGLEPVVLLLPGHALAGVRRRPRGRILPLDATYTPTSSFEQALAAGRDRARRAEARGALHVLDVRRLRPRIPPLPT